MKHLLTLILATVFCSARAGAATTYLESVSGDLSSNNLAPTPLSFSAGINKVAGTMGGDPGDGIPLDPDFFSFTIAPGLELTSIRVLLYSPPGQSFYAIALGTSINNTSSSDHLSNILVNGTGEILDKLDAGSYSGGLGFTAPLGAGTYTAWFQELASVVTYEMDYTLTAVPEPSRAVLLAAGFGICLLRRRRREQVPA
jgi:hypothetical protein